MVMDKNGKLGGKISIIDVMAIVLDRKSVV